MSLTVFLNSCYPPWFLLMRALCVLFCPAKLISELSTYFPCNLKSSCFLSLIECKLTLQIAQYKAFYNCLLNEWCNGLLWPYRPYLLSDANRTLCQVKSSEVLLCSVFKRNFLLVYSSGGKHEWGNSNRIKGALASSNILSSFWVLSVSTNLYLYLSSNSHTSL